MIIQRKNHLVSLLLFCMTSLMHSDTAYQNAGVNIDAGNQFVCNIRSLIKSTARPGATAEIGGFGGIFDLAKTSYHDPLLIGTTDGVGTKLKLAQEVSMYHTVGIDLVAMNVNDLLAQGVEPLFFLDYIATGCIDLKQAQDIMIGIVAGCKQSNCALIGGETAEMPGMYKSGEFDLAGFALGAVERTDLLPKTTIMQPGDLVIGLRSSGLHSNGFSLVRYLLEKNNIDLHAVPPFPSAHTHLYEVLLEPTKIYTAPLLPLLKQQLIKGIAHITGGGFFDNIPRILPDHLMVTIDTHTWQPDPVFDWLAQLGSISNYEMFRTFNMGIGMILIVAPDHAQEIIYSLQKSDQIAYCIGIVDTRDSEQQVMLNN